MRRILIDAAKCTGCKSCAVACMQSHRSGEGSLYDIDLQSPSNESRNIILQNSEKSYKPLFCRHCAKPQCVATCMSGALYKNPDTGHVLYDQEKCAQCFMCVMSCPFGVLKPDRATGTYVVKCDFCVNTGSQPHCASRCPSGAIRVQEVENTGGAK